ncbi:MAG: PQQ-dependent sugar dehydrogenase [Pseudomonadota bacterium]|nr:PQQ-dependent sugar dehydrogenase [Pseudomonadota bacterium]
MKRLLPLALGLVLGSAALAQEPYPFVSEPIAEFNEPWALEFLPDGRILVTEKAGTIQLVTQDGQKTAISGAPQVAYGGQGGLGDVKLHPEFEQNGMVYLSFSEAGPDETSGVAVGRGKLNLGSNAIENFEVIFRAEPKVATPIHFSQRLLFDDEGYLFVSVGERNVNAESDPTNAPGQHFDAHLGKILRLNDDGTPAAGNPFAGQGGISDSVWSMGHRNPLGIAFDSTGQLWNIEMAPRGGDELNQVIAGKNYGYPLLSNGNHYSGKIIPDHDTDTSGKFEAPKAFWNPVISPSSLIFYDGDQFPDWKGNAFITGLSSMSIVRVTVNPQNGAAAEAAPRFVMGKRMRGIKQGPDGNLWAIEDGAGGRLLKLSPRR